MRILGIDPGSRATGFGLIEVDGPRLRAVRWGRLTAPRHLPLCERLLAVYDGVRQVLEADRPDMAAVESVFFAQHPRGALVLGQARGVVLLAAAQAGLAVAEYSPLAIKQAVVGYGHAEKAQVQAMVQTLLGLQRRPSSDAADALAVAICHAHSEPLAAKLRASQARR